jgi:hypothetical protein
MNTPYRLVRPDGIQEYPPGIPVGGQDASAERMRLIPIVENFISQLPNRIVDSMWDESSDIEPIFHRLDTDAFESLMQEASEADKQDGAMVHLVSARIIPPAPFDDAFIANDIAFGSLTVLKSGTAKFAWSARSQVAVSTFRLAIKVAEDFRLPLIVDM